jgi:hypothetical protein
MDIESNVMDIESNIMDIENNVMDIEIKLEKKQTQNSSHALDQDILQLDKHNFQKMVFLYNALENGWSIKKRKCSYIFTKNHEGKKEVFDESYLSMFMKDNLNIKNILS